MMSVREAMEDGAVNQAFGEAIRAAFTQLVDNMSSGPDAGDPVAKFSAAVEIARAARDVARARLGLRPRNEV